MVVAWIGFATMAILVARYMKETWGKLCGKKAWFQVSKQTVGWFLPHKQMGCLWYLNSQTGQYISGLDICPGFALFIFQIKSYER